MAKRIRYTGMFAQVDVPAAGLAAVERGQVVTVADDVAASLTATADWEPAGTTTKTGDEG